MDRVIKPTLFYILVLLLGSCQTHWAQEYENLRIETGPGPEDLVADRISGMNTRIIFSMGNRREGSDPYGEIGSLDPVSGVMTVFYRDGEPDSLNLSPLGIDLALINDRPCLYVISNDDEQKRHWVIRYLITGDTLVFDRIFAHPLIHSPNALTVWPDGSFVVSNDAGKRGNQKEQILGLKRGSLVHVSADEHYTLAAEGLGMPAGISHQENTVYVSGATENKVYAFEWTGDRLVNKRVVCKVKGPDNIRWKGDRMLIACHVKTFRFIRHVSNAEVPSPTTVIELDPASGEYSTVFYDSGETISAGSVAVWLDGSYFTGQIFEPWIIKTKTPVVDRGFGNQ